MEQYIDSQEQWEDSVNADHDKRNERTKEQIDNRVEEYSCTETKPVIMKTYEELKAEASKIGVIAPESPGKAPIPTRQLCKRCMKYSGITFWTPDETWKRVTDDRYQHLCLPCFVDMADERMIDWEPGLLIYGESMAHLRERQERVARGEYTDEGLTEWKTKPE